MSKEGNKIARSKPSAVKSVVWIASPQSFAAKNIKGKKMKTVTTKSAKTVKTTLSKLTKGKQYTAKIRAYKKVSGKTYYFVWQSKSVKVKQ